MVPIYKTIAPLLLILLLMASSPTWALEDFLYDYPIFFNFQPEQIDEETMVSLEELSLYFDFTIYEIYDQVLCNYRGSFFIFTPGLDEVLVHGFERKSIYPTPLKINGHHLLPLTFVKEFFEGSQDTIYQEVIVGPIDGIKELEFYKEGAIYKVFEGPITGNARVHIENQRGDMHVLFKEKIAGNPLITIKANRGNVFIKFQRGIEGNALVRIESIRGNVVFGHERSTIDAFIGKNNLVVRASGMIQYDGDYYW